MSIRTNFMKRFLSLMITKVIYKKFGCSCKLGIDKLDISSDQEDKTKINISLNVDTKDLTKILLKIANG